MHVFQLEINTTLVVATQ